MKHSMTPHGILQDKRCVRGHRKVGKTEKKSNAYFGKSLVRLACKQEKNKAKSDRKNVGETKKAEKTREEVSSIHQMKHIIMWHVAATAEQQREKVCTMCWRGNSNSKKTQSESDFELQWWMRPGWMNYGWNLQLRWENIQNEHWYYQITLVHLNCIKIVSDLQKTIQRGIQ